MPPKARVKSKSSTAPNTSMTNRSEPTLSISVDSDNESIIEPAQRQSSSISNDADIHHTITDSILDFYFNYNSLSQISVLTLLRIPKQALDWLIKLIH